MESSTTKKIIMSKRNTDERIGIIVGGPSLTEARDQSDISDIWNSKNCTKVIDEHYLHEFNIPKSKKDRVFGKSQEYCLEYSSNDCDSEEHSIDLASSTYCNFGSFWDLYVCNTFLPLNLCCIDLTEKTPLIILRLDPTLRKFELLKFTIDLNKSLVQDILDQISQGCQKKRKNFGSFFSFAIVQTLYSEKRHLLKETDFEWPSLKSCNGTYDGLICRWPRGQTMINCIGLKKYDIRPYEVFIAKPTGMSKIDCCSIANPVIHNLIDAGVICRVYENDYSDHDSCQVFRSNRTEYKDTIITLSKRYR